VVVHAGELLSDEHGYFGEDLDDAFGLLNSNTLRACLTETGSPLALLVTHQIYEGIVKHELAGVDPVMYQRTRVRLKRKSIPAWLYTPTIPTPQQSPACDTRCDRRRHHGM
jgi:hypothetical protein